MLDKMCRPMVILVISGFRYAEAYAVVRWYGVMELICVVDLTTPQ